MKINSQGKCVELTKVEFEDLDFLWNHSSCFKVFCDRIRKQYEVTDNVAYNIAMAVTNRYKYMKVKEEK